MRQENHASPKRGISKMKSQGSAASNRKTLQSQIRQSAQNRLSINALDIVHGQLFMGDKFATAMELQFPRYAGFLRKHNFRC
jgi:hypothetical protein